MAELKQKQTQNVKKLPSENDTNPCYKEQRLSYECLSKHNYDASMCVIQFENYKQCKAFWNTIRIERMRNGIEPLIPPEDERKRILKERFQGKREV